MLAAIIGASLVGAQAVPAVSTGSIASVHSNILKKNTKTASWESTKVASSNTQPTGYFIANMFLDSNDCSSNQNMKFATGTGVCFTGYTNGTAVGSTAYEFEAAGNGQIIINNAVWTSTDCTGTPTVNTMPIPSSCIPTDEADQSIMYTYTSAATPWTNWDAGLMFQYFDEISECKASTDGVGGAFYWAKLGACITNDGGTSTTFDSCGDGKFSMTAYTDAKCTKFETSITQAIQVCVDNGDDSNDDDSADDGQAMETNNYRSMMCN
jgi:hypothetical protein